MNLSDGSGVGEVRTVDRHYRICARCVMDTSDPEITFDADNFCNHCVDFIQTRAGNSYHAETSRSELERIIDDVRKAGAGSDHDLVIGMSGGVDSSYLAYIACKEFGLRPLAVHMDNGWDSADSVSNIKNLVRGLGIDYECVVLNWPEFRKIQLAFLRASAPEAETPTDVAIPEVLKSTAERYGIRYIFGGGNLATEGILPKAWHYNACDRKYFEHITRTYGDGPSARFRFYDYRREMYFKLKGIKTVYPLNYLPFSKTAAIELLTEKVGFRNYGQKHHESRYTGFIQSYYLPEKFGIDYRRATFSATILDGQMDRDEALRLLKESPFKIDAISEGKQYVAKKLEITVDELEEIIKRPPTWYWQHPNDDGKLGFIYSVYRKLYGKKKLASV
ncbi:MAG TPA: N-acetyl sugar amidotransferase [Pyrinomonadaceae bacterium]